MDMNKIIVKGEVKIIRSEHFTAYEYNKVSPVYGEVYETRLLFNAIGTKIEDKDGLIHVTMTHITPEKVRETTTIEYRTPKDVNFNKGDT